MGSVGLVMDAKLLPNHAIGTVGDRQSTSEVPVSSLSSAYNEPHLSESTFDLPVAEYPVVSNAPFPTDATEIRQIFESTLARLNTILSSRNFERLNLVFGASSYWRDHLGINPKKFTTLVDRLQIIDYLKDPTNAYAISSISIETGKAPVVSSVDPGALIKCLQAFVTFENEYGRGRGSVSLLQDALNQDEWRIFSVFTTLTELKEHKWRDGNSRTFNSIPDGWGNGVNWSEYRQKKRDFTQEEPTVLVVGAGHSGLMIAARLQMLGIETLLIDRQERSGDAWRTRYHDLVLHDVSWMNSMPYLPFPPTWPVLTAKDKIADFFEFYESALELNLWNQSQVTRSSWNSEKKRWAVEVDRKVNGQIEKRTIHPRHIVQATGLNGEPQIPSLPGMDDFKGRIVHTTEFTNADSSYKGKKVVVIGAGSSGHDIALTCYGQGAEVTMIQRSPMFIVSLESAHIGLRKRWNEQTPTDESDISAFAIPLTLFKRIGSDVSNTCNRLDQTLLDGLRAVGFQLIESATKPAFVALTIQRAGGFYIDVGASSLIAQRKIGHRFSPKGISHFTPSSVVLATGEELEADEVILATGFSNGRVRTRKVFGDAVADRIEPIWGFDQEGEIRGAWRRSGHEAFWVGAGSFFISRYYSRLLALQIKMCEENLTGL